MGKVFSNIGSKSPLDFAIALFIGLSVFNCIFQVITSSTNLINSNSTFKKTLSYPLENLSFKLILKYAIILAINISVCIIFIIVLNFNINLSALGFLFYLMCIFFCRFILASVLAWSFYKKYLSYNLANNYLFNIYVPFFSAFDGS